MIIRESPTSQKSPSKAAWPPRSPREALQLSPSRQKRLREGTRNVSPSPLKRRRTTPPEIHLDQEIVEDNNEEDEETLQLQLQEIQARLKLKKLQKLKQQGLQKEDSKSREIEQAIKVQVPHSPKAPLRSLDKPPESPRRVQLGIDKGLRAEDVSLKKGRKDVLAKGAHQMVAPAKERWQPAKKSFSERLLEARSTDVKREERRDRLDKSRVQGFGIFSRSTENGSKNLTVPSEKRDVPKALSQSVSVPDDGRRGLQDPFQGNRVDKDIQKMVSDKQADGASVDSEDFEPFSKFHLSTRYIDQDTLSEALSDKTLFDLPNLLRQVTGPDYDPPDCDDDYIVLGTIASKSTPYNHAQKHQSTGDSDSLPARSKFMVMKLTDLKWEVDLFLFDTAFDRFWKLTEGTVVALLNPAIMPPKPHMRDTGRFSLKLASSEDTVLEIGTARDLGWCESIKKDGKQCAQWVNKKKSDFCDFHVNLGIDRARAGRMEINGMVSVGLFGNSVKNERGGKFGGGGDYGKSGKRNGRRKEDGLIKEGPRYDRSTGETAWVVPQMLGSRGSTAQLLDAEDYVHGGLSKTERSRQRLAAKEKERDLAKALWASGSGIGSEYMRLKQVDINSSNTERAVEIEKPKDAAALGLTGRTATNVTLSPVRSRKSKNAAARAKPMGWGGAFKRGLLDPPPKPVTKVDPPQNSSAKADGSESPRKKARFLLEQKGIRVPGRDSLANPVAISGGDDNDDDELDII